MTKYGKKSRETVQKEMQKFKREKIRNESGRTVINPKQVIAIGLSEVRNKAVKVPTRRKIFKYGT